MNGDGGTQGKSTTPWETDYQLLLCEGLFSEYLDMGERYRNYREYIWSFGIRSHIHFTIALTLRYKLSV